MRRRLVRALAAVGCLTGLSCSAGTVERDPATAGGPVDGPAGFTPEAVDWRACDSGRLCGTLEVPLDYADPTGPTLTLALMMAPAGDPDQRLGALLVNPGGPGGSGIEFVQSGLDYAPEVRARFDVVGFDPRGVGQSNEVPCGEETVPPFREVDSDPDSPEEQAELDAAARAVAEDCARAAGDLLPHIGTDDVVRDIDSIRAALGEEKLNFAGYSYGTLLGLRYAELFGANARAIVLDGVVDPTQDLVTFLRGQTVGFEAALSQLFARCPPGGAGCPDGGAEAAYDAVAARVEEDPLPAGDDATLGPGELPVAAIYSTYVPSLAPSFFQALAWAQDGDGSLLKSMARAYQEIAHFTSYAGVECIDSPHPVGAEAYAAFADELDAVSPRFGASVANELLPCAFWPAEVRSVIGPVVAPAAPPVLVIGTTGDAATPFVQAERVAATLEEATLLTYDAAGHTSYGSSSCTRAAVGAYLVALELPAPGTVCQD